MRRCSGIRILQVFLSLIWAPFAAAQPGPSADEFIQAGIQAIAQIDAGRIQEIWKNASPVLQQKIAVDALTSAIRKSREGVSVESARSWSAVSRTFYAVGNEARVPTGIYVNVNYVTQLRSGKTLTELVSFRQEPDAQWRMSGYVAKQMP